MKTLVNQIQMDIKGSKDVFAGNTVPVMLGYTRNSNNQVSRHAPRALSKN